MQEEEFSFLVSARRDACYRLPRRMLKNLILVGFMGTGKSTIGRQLSKILGYPLVDTDALIVAAEKRAISEIFATEGEEYFRDLETRLLRDLCREQTHKQIISTGGGIVLREENRRLLRELGFVIWLVAQPETILERTSRNRERPLLHTEDPAGTIRQLLKERDAAYNSSAHLTLETTGLTFSEISTGIIESARYHYGH